MLKAISESVASDGLGSLRSSVEVQPRAPCVRGGPRALRAEPPRAPGAVRARRARERPVPAGREPRRGPAAHHVTESARAHTYFLVSRTFWPYQCWLYNVFVVSVLVVAAVLCFFFVYLFSVFEGGLVRKPISLLFQVPRANLAAALGPQHPREVGQRGHVGA